MGKSCLFFHFEDNKFHESFSPTIGLDLRSKLMKVKGKDIKLIVVSKYYNI